MKINYINCIFVEGYFYPHPLEKITAGDWTLIYNYKKMCVYEGKLQRRTKDSSVEIYFTVRANVKLVGAHVKLRSHV